MNKQILEKHVDKYLKKQKIEKGNLTGFSEEDYSFARYYEAINEEKLLAMDEMEFSEFISQLYAMLIWGNKQYKIDQIIEQNGFEKVKKELANLLFGSDEIETRWDYFRKNTKGFGPAMMSELLCKIDPQKYMIWNQKEYKGYKYLGITDLPVYNYQVNGKKYREIINYAQKIIEKFESKGIKNMNFLLVDYFIWDELQIETEETVEKEVNVENNDDFIHNEIRDKIKEIGEMLGFNTRIEVKIAHGSVVDVVWEFSVGNMGKIMYAFEVQTKGSINSLLINLQKATNSPSVQGIIAVSDTKQLEKIKREAEGLHAVKNLRFWDYREVLDNHEKLVAVTESINELQLVPDVFKEQLKKN